MTEHASEKPDQSIFHVLIFVDTIKNVEGMSLS